MKKKQLFAGALAAAMMTASLAGCGWRCILCCNFHNRRRCCQQHGIR